MLRFEKSSKSFQRFVVFSFLFLAVTVFSGAAFAWSMNDLPTPTVTPEQRTLIHSKVDAMKDDLIDTMLDGASYDSISWGSSKGITPTEYPFPVHSGVSNDMEGQRKTAKYAWVKEVAKELGFNVIRQYQEDKFVYVEIGDPDAPEMILALSHLDSPTQSISSPDTTTTAGMNRYKWRDEDGNLDPDAYKKPYKKNGWMYGAGLQDDSGPTLATLFSIKALMDAGLPMDRRIRVGMGAYEDAGPGTPSAANTRAYMEIPYYTGNPSFYDNWAYKYLNREEMPIAAFTSDSRFPVIMGNSVSKQHVAQMVLSDDVGKPFSLVSGTMLGAPKRTNDPTLEDYISGSGHPVPSHAVFALNVAGVDTATIDAFRAAITSAATARNWDVKTDSDPNTVMKVALREETVEGVSCLVIEINTDIAMEAPTPQYGSNAVVWGMYMLDSAFSTVPLADSLVLVNAAASITDLFMRDNKEDYYGTYMGLGERIIENGCPRLTISPFTPATRVGNSTIYGLNGNNSRITDSYSFYDGPSGVLTAELYIRSMYDSKASYDAAEETMRTAWREDNWTIAASSVSGAYVATTATTGLPTLYNTHDNYMTSLHLASYRNSLEGDGFDDLVALMDISYPQGTTGGTLASNYFNKMNAFGAVLPGNERWWHAPNERMTEKSAVQMTKIFADGMLEMARYAGPGGAKFMWADIEGLNADRADLDLLDVVLDTYKDAKADVPGNVVGDGKLVAATTFDIPMFAARGNSTKTAQAIAAGHASGGIYLDPASIPADDTFVLPMRFEFKLTKDALGLDDVAWDVVTKENVAQLLSRFTFKALHNGESVTLEVPEGQTADKFFYKRISQYDPNALYLSVHLAIVDSDDMSISTVVADSKTDLFKLNDTWANDPANAGWFVSHDWLATRGEVEQRGFFVIGDGAKDARFQSPTAVFLTLDPLAGGVSLNKSTLNLKVGDSETLEATVIPADVTNQSVSWSSDNAAVATVDENGKVTAIAAGTATITATVDDTGHTAACVVRVTSDTPAPGVEAVTPPAAIVATATVAPIAADAVHSDSAAVTAATDAISDPAVKVKVEQLLTQYAYEAADGALYSDPNSFKTLLAGMAEDTGLDKSGVAQALPVFAFDVSAGKIGVVSFKTKLDSFTGVTFENIVVTKILTGNTIHLLSLATDPANMKDGEFLFFDGENVVAATSKPEAGKEYLLCVAVKDGGTFDLDPNQGKVLDPVVIAKRSGSESQGGVGSSGCSTAGFASFGLFSLATLFLVRRKK